MYISIEDMLSVTVTLVSRLDANDAGGKYDVLHSYVIPGAQWDIKTEATTGGNTLDVGSIIKIQLPKAIQVERDGQTVDLPYMPYKEWKNAPENGYTCRIGDTVIRGIVSEEITAQNIRDIKKSYASDLCTVRAVNDRTVKKGLSLNGDSVGALKWVEFVAVDGV